MVTIILGHLVCETWRAIPASAVLPCAGCGEPVWLEDAWATDIKLDVICRLCFEALVGDEDLPIN